MPRLLSFRDVIEAQTHDERGPHAMRIDSFRMAEGQVTHDKQAGI